MTTEVHQISRQARLQQRYVAEGRCALCGRKRPKDLSQYCREHTDKRSAAKRERVGCQPWQPGHRGRPPKWYVHLVRTRGRTVADLEAARRASAC